MAPAVSPPWGGRLWAARTLLTGGADAAVQDTEAVRPVVKTLNYLKRFPDPMLTANKKARHWLAGRVSVR